MSATLAFPISVAPATAENDPVRALQAAERSRILGGILRQNAAEDEPTARVPWERMREVFAVLPARQQAEIVLHPLYGLWSLRLSALRRERKVAESLAWSRHLGRFFLAPATSCAAAEGWRLAVPMTNRELRLPGVVRHLRFDADAEEATVEIGKGELEISAAGNRRVVTADNWNGGAGFPGMVERPSRDGIEVDASDPWIGQYLAGQRRRAPEPGYPRRDVRPLNPVSAGHLQAVERALSMLRASWPEFHAEVCTHVRMLVPFESDLLVGWTHVSLPGAIFIRSVPDNMLFTLERLAHEASHVRLYLMSIYPLFTTDSTPRLFSAFRKDLRPVAGVYHAAFVYGRLIEMMRRGHAVLGESALEARADELQPLYHQTVASARGSDGLTELGEALLDELDARVEAWR